MGRGTEFFDYINSEKEPSTDKYTHLTITGEIMAVRRDVQMRKKQEHRRWKKKAKHKKSEKNEKLSQK